MRFTGAVNNIYQRESEINEVSRGRYNNSNYKGGYNNNKGNNNYKGMNDYYGKKDWNKNTKGFLPEERREERIQGQGCVPDPYKGCQILLSCRIR